MERIEILYQCAYEEGIEITKSDLRHLRGLSVELEKDNYIIVLNNSRYYTLAELLSAIAHEMGHCVRGALYNERTPIFTRGACERKADEWAIINLVPYGELMKECKGAFNRVWELAEYFNVEEDLIKKALVYYKLYKPVW